MAQYQIEVLDNSKQKWDIPSYVNIGSDESCAVCLSTPFLEPRHARLEVKDIDFSLLLIVIEGEFGLKGVVCSYQRIT